MSAVGGVIVLKTAAYLLALYPLTRLKAGCALACFLSHAKAGGWLASFTTAGCLSRVADAMATTPPDLLH